jgi:hypothetical protein
MHGTGASPLTSWGRQAAGSSVHSSPVMFAALGFADRRGGGSLVPLSSSDGGWVGLVGQHGSVDDVGESAFEDDVRLPCPARGRVEPCLGQGDRCSAALSWRFPVHDRRCRCLFDDHAGNGAVPLCRANASLERTRPTWAVSPMIFATVNAPQPTIASKRGGDRGDPVGDPMRSSISAVSSRKCSTRRSASRRRRMPSR